MIKKELVVAKEPRSPISETFRALRTNLQFMNSTTEDKQTILVTSTSPSEGKSWVSANVAITFAQAGKKTCLVDVDMRKGRLYTMLNANPTPGVSNYLTGVNVDKEIKDITGFIQETEMPMLYIIPAGSIPPNPSELLVSSKMIKLLEKLESVCDIIIIDGTPCELVTDSLILSRMVDSTIIVTAHKVTKKDALARVVKNVQNVGGNITGVLINKMPVSTKRYEERYYYYGKDPSFFNENIKQVKKVAPIEIQKPIINRENQKTEDILKQMNEYLDKTKRRKDK